MKFYRVSSLARIAQGNLIMKVSIAQAIMSGGEFFEQFDLTEFFATYETMFRTLPRLTRHTMGEGQYTADWARLSTRLRRAANWICSECSVNCSNDRDLLHVHHRDGNRGNNQRNNLQILCIDCHSRQPAHSRLRPSPNNAVVWTHFEMKDQATSKY